MKVRVLKAFLDDTHGNRPRFEGTIYETTMERAAMLTKKGFVKLLEPPKEYTLPDEPEEKKGRPKGMTTVKKKKK